jgi:uncharacterized membrane protein YeaQ/YmgE (transglycosylase-associated protein family)
VAGSAGAGEVSVPHAPPHVSIVTWILAGIVLGLLVRSGSSRPFPGGAGTAAVFGAGGALVCGAIFTLIAGRPIGDLDPISLIVSCVGASFLVRLILVADSAGQRPADPVREREGCRGQARAEDNGRPSWLKRGETTDV